MISFDVSARLRTLDIQEYNIDITEGMLMFSTFYVNASTTSFQMGTREDGRFMMLGGSRTQVRFFHFPAFMPP